MSIFRRRGRPDAGPASAADGPRGAADRPVDPGEGAAPGTESYGSPGPSEPPNDPSMNYPSTNNGRPMTMEERIQAFFRQSGGPNNPEIPKLVEKHLLYGKDHGIPGYRETFADAFIDAVVGDPSLLLLYERVQRWRAERQRERRDTATAVAIATDSQLLKRLERLEQEVTRLRQAVERLGATP
ncbi:hypothetical protein Tmar_1524 [Thermaerobacter marianensis DSM 12885]|uniref:Uncharacterized protein n=1 Tax=Thermaerobacter marianensis (strain ATCC 700841 / DSM 12885 / JCM 10246 / 7p75a) TaxID=644966 RepID=E6SGI3_THEM7|nr:hypothetical protein [Thermaerobacter marianensis]ADU51635.1 hypothetical protein Tmar_1524 [Thermaerobacter marianensis DSM 12885]